MSIDKPDISYFERAIDRLEEGLARHYQNENDELKEIAQLEVQAEK